MKLTITFLFVTLLIGNCFSMPEEKAKTNSSRLLLTKLRGGDYTHPGDEEAIDMVWKKILTIDPQIANKATLDVGSGFGGTANYLYHKGFTDIQGIDLNPAAVEYAKKRYPSIPFTHTDALDNDKVYPPNSFSFLYLFNVIYAIKDKATFVKKLATVSRQGGILVLFDYTQEKENAVPASTDLANKLMYPLQIDEIGRDLKEAGWKILEITDVTQQYLVWYKQLLEKLALQSPFLTNEFSGDDISKVKETFTFLYNQLNNWHMGGTIIYARKV